MGIRILFKFKMCACIISGLGVDLWKTKLISNISKPKTNSDHQVLIQDKAKKINSQWEF